MKKLLLFLVPSLFLLWGCPPCDRETIDKGKLSEYALLYVPYTNGDTLTLQHSGGKLIRYAIRRETQQVTNTCAECCDEIISEENLTTITPDYPIFSISVSITEYDSNYVNCTVSIGKNAFYISSDSSISKPKEKLVVNEKTYRQVYQLKSYSNSYYSNDSIYADSMYYNCEKGIIQIIMSNNEKYTLYE